MLNTRSWNFRDKSLVRSLSLFLSLSFFFFLLSLFRLYSCLYFPFSYSGRVDPNVKFHYRQPTPAITRVHGRGLHEYLWGFTLHIRISRTNIFSRTMSRRKMRLISRFRIALDASVSSLPAHVTRDIYRSGLNFCQRRARVKYAGNEKSKRRWRERERERERELSPCKIRAPRFPLSPSRGKSRAI